MKWISSLAIFVSLLHSVSAFGATLTAVPGCSSLGSHVQSESDSVAINGAGQTAYAWIDSNGVIHAAVTLAGETSCIEIPTPNVQGVIPARSIPPQVTIDNLGNIKVAFLTATSNNYNLPPAAPQTINGIKVSTLNINILPLQWTDISAGLIFTQSATARGNGNIQLSLAGNGQGDAMLIWFEEQAQLNGHVQAAIFNTGIGSPQWITYTLDAASNIGSASINFGNVKPTASINSSGQGMFFWLGSIEGSPPLATHLRAAPINAVQTQVVAPPAPTPENVGHHVDFGPGEGIFAYAGAIDEAGDALAIWPDRSAGFQQMQYNTYSAGSGQWGTQDPDRTIPGSSVTFQTNTRLVQLATDPNSMNSFAVWNQTQMPFVTTLYASAYNKGSDTWTQSAIVVDETTGEYGIGVDCLGDGIFIYRHAASEIQASVFPDIGTASLGNRQNLGVIDIAADIIILPILAVAHECLPGNTRMGASLWGVQTDADNFFLQSAFFDLPTVVPPSNFRGNVTKVRFASQTDLVNQLTWAPSPDPSVIGYLIRGSDDSVAEVLSSGPYRVTFHCRDPHVVYTYTIVAFSADGQSAPLTVVLGGN